MRSCSIRRFRKYRAVFQMEVQYSLRYRANTLFYLSSVILPVVLQYFLWTTVFRDQRQVGPYDLSAMLTYYTVAVFLSHLRLFAWWDIGYAIKDGRMALHLVRPWNPFLLYLVRALAWTSSAFLLLLLAYLPLVFGLLHTHLRAPASPQALLWMLLFWFLGGLFTYTVGYLVNLLAFWTEGVTGILWLLAFLEEFLSGALVPLNLLPGSSWWIHQPFAFLGYLPARIYLGQASGAELAEALGILLGVLAGLIPLAQAVFQRGLRGYQPAGG